MDTEESGEVKRHQISTLSDFGMVDVGDFLAGEKVLRIYSRASKHIIYERASGVAYGAVGVTAQQRIYLADLDQLKIQAQIKFKGVHDEAVQSHKNAILNAILSVKDEDVIKSSLLSFDKFIKEIPAVTNVVGQNLKYVVWIGDAGVEHWIKEVSEHAELLSQFYKIKSLGAIVVPKSKLKTFYGKLASCFVVGLGNGGASDENVFDPVRVYIDKCVGDAARIRLVTVIFSFSIFVLICVASLWLYVWGVGSINSQALLIGVFGGVLGAMISVLQRAKELKVELYESVELIVLQGAVRIGLGCVFGIVALVASKSGLLLELLSQSNNKMFLLSVIAGFSERLVPDFIGRISEDGVK